MNYAEMSAKKLLETLNAVDELDKLEAKSLRDDIPRGQFSKRYAPSQTSPVWAVA